MLAGWLQPLVARITSTLFVLLYFGLYFQMQLDILPAVRAEDDAVVEKIAAIAHRCPRCVVLYQNRAAATEHDAGADNLKPGLRGGGPAMDLVESPFVAYWTQSQLSQNVLRVASFGWTAVNTSASATDVLLYRGNRAINVPLESVVVVANMALTLEGTLEGVHVFEHWQDYVETVRSSRLLKGRELIADLAPFAHDDRALTIDLGRRNAGLGRTVLRDKLYGESGEPGFSGNALVADYGLYGGANSVYTIGDVPDASYYSTNRNGDLVYRIDLKPGSERQITVALDFWDFWGSRKRDRRFAVDFKLDDAPWDEGIEVDTGAQGGDQPFAVKVRVDQARTILIRLRRLEGSIDTPLIQGIRLESPA